MNDEYPEELLKLLKKVKGKRAQVVIDHILEHGIITTEEIEKYGYKHPPRAARDVRERGVPLKTVHVTSSDGKRIAAYVFGDLSEIKKGRIGGRKVIPKKLKESLIEQFDSKCFICSLPLVPRALQVDHRVPYEVQGDEDWNDWTPSNYMLLCVSCQRAKSWSCEHCDNWNTDQEIAVCEECYWAKPESYSHIALVEVRRLDITWSGEETKTYDIIKKLSSAQGVDLPDFVKEVIDKYLERT